MHMKINKENQKLMEAVKKKTQLVFIPSPGISHLVPTVELANLIVNHNDKISIIFLVIQRQPDSKISSYIDSLTSSISNRLQFIKLPIHPLTSENFIETQKPNVKEIVTNILNNQTGIPDSPRLAGFVIDMFCTSMISVANEFKVPTYLYFTSNVTFLGLMFHLKMLHDDEKVDVTLLEGSDSEWDVPFLVNRVPAKVLPSVFFSKDMLPKVLGHARIFGQTRGIIVNSFLELEPFAIQSLRDSQVPRVYPVGPILNIKDESSERLDDKSIKSDIMKWLDGQSPSSVVFLCFGSQGSFGVDQVNEIAKALESSGQRFIWSLRKPPPIDTGVEAPTEYTNPEEVLPIGFLDRTINVGRIIGWAPQTAILSHPSIGGFVSHCGWNSTLESLWFGVPIAAWPMYAEQQVNAFQLVVELGLAVEIKMDYRRSFIDKNDIVVSANEIEMGIRGVMQKDSEIRARVKKISEASRVALVEGGSSYKFLDNFICDVENNNV